MKTLKLFFSKDYSKFNSSQLEFRKSMLKIIQILTSISCVIYMIIAFPFQKELTSSYILIPLFVVTANAIGFMVQRKRCEKYCPTFLLILIILGQTISIELNFSISVGYENKYRVFFSGLYAGITLILGFLNFSSSLHKLLISLSLFTQIIVKDIHMGQENFYARATALLFTLFLINCVFLKTEILFYQIWSSWLSRNESLLHFQKLIQDFPSHILIINKNSYLEDKPLYCNKEAQIPPEGHEAPCKSLVKYLDSFKIKDINNEINVKKRDNKYDSLSELIFSTLNSTHFSTQDYRTFICDRESNDRWTVQLGRIEWSQKEALILIFNDISKTEKIKELQMLDRNKNKLLATVSHELRTPINGTLGMIENAQGLLTENQQEIKYCLDIARNSTKTLLFMVNDILDLEQIRHGKLRLNIESVNLHNIVQKVLPLIEVQIKHRNLELVYENRCPVETKVLVDSARLQQILWNLLWNACKFTSSGFVKLQIILKEMSNEINPNRSQKTNRGIREINEDDVFLKNQTTEADEPNELEISIVDTGMGMDAQTMRELFQDFGKKENSCNPTGVGLGLAISQSLVKQMHSSGITVESELGKGSKFSFGLVVSNYDNDDDRMIPSELPSINLKSLLSKIEDNELISKSINKTFKLLLVDDDLANHCVFDLYLKGLRGECYVLKAYNGKDALNILLEKASEGEFFDIILMDCNMPIMDGYQATIAIKELIRQGRIPDVKIVALTANNSAEEKDNCLKIGMIDIWCKPISKSEFLTNIKNLLKRR